MSRGATARLFVAVDPPDAAREELAVWARAAAAAAGAQRAGAKGASLRLLPAQALHLTLCFLGARPVAEIDTIAAALGTCAADAGEPSAGELSLGAPLWLPPRRPRALAVEVHDHAGRLARLHQAATRAISDASDWTAERRRFAAHITVARVRGRVSSARHADADAQGPTLPATPRLSFTATSVILYRSWLSPAGAAYEALATYQLAGGDR